MHTGSTTARDGPDDEGRLLYDIVAYAARVRRGNHRCPATNCPHCGRPAQRQRPFKRHAFRRRKFLVIRDRYVETVQCSLARWRCPDCRRTFTEYPSFALPRKHYVLPQMTHRALRYVEDDGLSYRKGVRKAFLPVFHLGDPSTPPDPWSRPVREPAILAHTSLHRWVSTFGTLGGKRLDRRKPVERRSAFLPAEWKFTTGARRGILIACRSCCRHGVPSCQ